MPRLTLARNSENWPGSGFDDDEIEFIKAVDRYKRERQRPFPTCRELLYVLKEIGYRKAVRADARLQRC